MSKDHSREQETCMAKRYGLPCLTPTSCKAAGKCLCEAVDTNHIADVLIDALSKHNSLERRVEKLRAQILVLRELVGTLPITHCNSHPDLQAWFDKMKTTMAATNPTWLSAPPMTAAQGEDDVHLSPGTDVAGVARKDT